jgi:hypothetical protein
LIQQCRSRLELWKNSVRISTGILAVLIVFAMLLSPSKQMVGQYLDQTAAAHIEIPSDSAAMATIRRTRNPRSGILTLQLLSLEGTHIRKEYPVLRPLSSARISNEPEDTAFRKLELLPSSDGERDTPILTASYF